MTALLKTMGLSGTPVYGKLLIERIGDMESAEFLDELTGLVSQGYVLCDKVNVRTMEDVATESTARPRLRAQVVTSFAGLALLLAATGVCSVALFAQAQPGSPPQLLASCSRLRRAPAAVHSRLVH